MATEAYAPLTCSNELLGDPARLAARLDQDGYLYCKAILPVQRLLGLRRQILEICHRHGWIQGGGALLDAIATGVPANEGDDAYFLVYDEVQKLEDFHSLAHDPGLAHLMRAAIGESAFPHPLAIVRLVFPDNSEFTTPPHQDYPNNQGTPNLYASWIPLGDCPVSLGGLAILESSHKRGLLPRRFALGPGSRQAELDEELQSHRWLAGDMSAGDVLVFHSLTVHRALDNRSLNRMRISCDFRFQCQGEPLSRPCLSPHFGRLTWEQVYASWQSTAHQYYWHGLDYEVIEWDPAYHELPDGHMQEALRALLKYQKRLRSRTVPGTDE